MFLLITIVTVWSLLIFDTVLLERPIAAHNITSFIIFWPTTSQGWLIIGLWGMGMFYLLFTRLTPTRTTRGVHKRRGPIAWLLSLSDTGNMHRFDWGLIIVSIFLTISGWIIGISVVLLLGGILFAGFVLSTLEHWLA